MNGRCRLPQRVAMFLCLSPLAISLSAFAEPHLAIQTGLKCGVCHTSPSGGGMRTIYGNIFAQQELPAHSLLEPGETPNFWTGKVLEYLAVGGDVRGGWSQTSVPGQETTSDSDLEEFLGYVDLQLIPGNLNAYVDAKLLPEDAVIREGYVKLSTSNGRYYLRGGQFFLPYGLRIQDDSAFIRQIPGINYNTPDNGWEVGLEKDNWSAQLAVTRGTAGGPEIDSGKQYSALVTYVTPKWRVGGSLNYNDSSVGDRRMQNIFGGIRTGRINWLAEIDYIIDEGTPTGRRESWMSFVEANIAARKGHNFKLTFEYYDPDVDVSEDQQNRLSVVWEYFPIKFLQTRIGYRWNDGIPQNPAQNRESVFAEVHIPF